MSGTTPNFALPYPSGTDTPAGHTQIQALAVAVDQLLKKDGFYTSGGYVLGRGICTADTGSTGTNVDCAGMSCTFTLSVTRLIVVHAAALFNASVAGMLAGLFIAGLPAGSNLIARQWLVNAGGTGQTTAGGSVPILCPAGTYTLKGQVARVGGAAGTASVIAYYSSMTVVDGGRNT